MKIKIFYLWLLVAALFAAHPATAQYATSGGQIERIKLVTTTGQVHLKNVQLAYHLSYGYTYTYQWEREALYDAYGNEFTMEPYPSAIASRRWLTITGATTMDLNYTGPIRYTTKFRRKAIWNNGVASAYSNEQTTYYQRVTANTDGDTLYLRYDDSNITSASIYRHTPQQSSDIMLRYETTAKEYRIIIKPNQTYYERGLNISFDLTFSPTYVSCPTSYSFYMTQPAGLVLDPMDNMRDKEYHIIDSYYDTGSSDYNRAITYFDGLGRESQTIRIGAAPSSTTPRDIVSFYEYDSRGRKDTKSYLPHAMYNSSGSMVIYTSPTSDHASFYNSLYGSEGQYAYVGKQYDNSPLGVVTAQSTPGSVQSLGQNPERYEYRLNVAGDNIRCYIMSGNNLKFDGFYPANTLTVRIIKHKELADAGNTEYTQVLEFMNARGQLIARDVVVSPTEHRVTYYVYDEMDRQRYIVPPKQNATLANAKTYTPDDLKLYCYYTEYDKRGNPSKEYIPGKEYILKVYDKKGRLVLAQDGNLRAAGKWAFTKYDKYDRPVITGLCGGTLAAHQTAIENATSYNEQPYTNAGGLIHGYTNLVYPYSFSANDCLTVNYYDNYNFPGSSSYTFNTTEAMGTRQTAVSGFLTATKVRVLDGSSTPTWLTTVTYYDTDYRVLQTVSDLYPSGKETVSNQYNFVGDLLCTKVAQTPGATTYRYQRDYTYDNYSRLLKVNQTIDKAGFPYTSMPTLTLASYTYDALGRISQLKLHNDRLTIQYTYDIAGRPIGQSSPYFTYNLAFTKSDIADIPARADGNIAYMSWGNNVTEPDKVYAYTYDKQGQLNAADYRMKNNGAWVNAPAYDANYTYDENGNLTRVTRYSMSGSSGGYTMTYEGNQLKKANSSEDYVYDRNGNMTYDGRRKVNIEYNELNLPSKIFAGSQSVSYIYGADGRKLAMNAGGSLTYYRGDFVYSGYMPRLLNPYGMFNPDGLSSWSDYYFMKDHLGSTRMVISIAGTADPRVVQTTEYYPFGLAMNSLGNLSSNKYLYNGKEYQDAAVGDLGALGLYDYGARFYDPEIGRWFNIDPALQLANPYVYCANNPVMMIDPDGRSTNPVYDEDTGELLGTDEAGLAGKPIVMKRDDFRQGMAHQTALEKGQRFESAKSSLSETALQNILSNFESLPSRPDYDGKLTLNEANNWYRNGSGQPLYVDLNQIDLSGIISLGDKYVGQEKVFNLLVHGNLEDGLVYGNIKLKRYPDDQVRAYSDKYDFNMHSWFNPLNWGRNVETIIGQKVAGQGRPYDIHINGSATLPALWPINKNKQHEQK